MIGSVALAAVLAIGALMATVDPITLGTYLAFAAVGGFLVHRRPRNAIGWLLIGIGFTFIGTSTPPGLDIERLEAGTATARDTAYAWVGTWAGGASFLLYASLAMVFPSGRLPVGPWRRVAITALVVAVIVIALPAFSATLRFSIDGRTDILAPNPVGFLPRPGADMIAVLQVIVTAVPLVILAGAVVSLLVRYRRAHGIEALQIRWLLTSVALVVLSVVFGLIGFVATGMTVGYVWIPAILAYPTVPLAVGIAVTRYRLFEIDRLISRTIAYALITAVLFAVFAGVNLGLQASLGSIVRGNAVAVAISTLVVAALFNPVRVRLQHVVDRRFNRARADQEAALARFTTGLRNEVDVDRVLGAMRIAAEGAVEPTFAAVWQRRRGAAS